MDWGRSVNPPQAVAISAIEHFMKIFGGVIGAVPGFIAGFVHDVPGPASSYDPRSSALLYRAAAAGPCVCPAECTISAT